jgi:hypothetical protein
MPVAVHARCSRGLSRRRRTTNPDQGGSGAADGEAAGAAVSRTADVAVAQSLVSNLTLKDL